MPTLGALKTRIRTELDRDDMGTSGALEGVLTDAIARAVEFHSDEAFWFNRASGSATTSNGDATLDPPSGVRIATGVARNGALLARAALGDIEHLAGSGAPAAWAGNEGAIQLSPVPDGAYTLVVYGLASTGVPALDADANIWTTEAYDLIAARVRLTLLRDVLRDSEGAALAKLAEDEALARLRRETSRRGRTGMTTDLPGSP